MLRFGRHRNIAICLIALGGIFCFFGFSARAAGVLSPTVTATITPAFTETVPVLMYHYVSLPPATTTLPGLYIKPEIFEQQLQEIKNNHYPTFFASELTSSLRNKNALPSHSLVLTFDDGYEDFYSHAFPLLKKYQIKGTVYVIINALDKPGYLTRLQVKELAQSGLVEIGSHTFNHPDLRTKKLKDAAFEIQNSRSVLKKLCGQAIQTFAYPYGYFNDSVLRLVSAAGYSGAFTVKPGSEHSTDSLFTLKRLRPDNRVGESFISWLKQWFR
jgi:peptidoglycan/xylan/chitin deacetylase (PgdA/CDA1 family)